MSKQVWLSDNEQAFVIGLVQHELDALPEGWNMFTDPQRRRLGVLLDKLKPTDPTAPPQTSELPKEEAV